jgi:uncharacterized protein (DUF2062 family)
MEAPVTKILVVIPVYNHASLLRPVVSGACGIGESVLVIDDGSTDAPLERVLDLPCATVRHEKNRGKGAAIMSALVEAERIGATHLLTIDADGQHDPGGIPSFAAAIGKDPEAIIIGVRDFASPSIPGTSRFGRSFSNFWFRLQTGKSLRDTQSGFRVYPVRALRELDLRETGYAFEVEVLVKAAWAGVPLKEVDIPVHYPPAGERISHFHAFWDNLRLSRLNTKLTLRAILPFPHRQMALGGKEAREVSILHPWRSMRMLLAENCSPSQLAAAMAIGVFVGTMPFIGTHTLVVLVAASFLRLNKLVAVGASQLGMPPFVPALAIEVGHYIRHGRWLTEISMRTLGYEALDRLVEWIIGSLVLAPVLAVLVGAITWAMALAVRGADHAD